MEIFNKNTILSIFLYYFRNFEKNCGGLRTGYENFILFIDDFRKHTWIFPLIGFSLCLRISPNVSSNGHLYFVLFLDDFKVLLCSNYRLFSVICLFLKANI